MPTLQANQLFADRYLLIKNIGIGGYSEVWKAQDTISGNLEVALKIFAPDKGLDTKGLEVFSKEYSLVFNIIHKHLLVPKHFDIFNNSPYLVMQYCNNGSLYGKIGEFSEAELAKFMQQAAMALAFLHEQEPPIIHQDIKPDNFLIDNRGDYLLTDFGISSKIRRTLTKSMAANVSSGTIAYMPPEKWTKEKLVIKAGDIFSLGVTMFELITGELPLGEQGGIMLNSGAEIPNLPVQFSKELNTLLDKCMSKDPWERPTAKDLEERAKYYLETGNWERVKGGLKTEPIIEKPKTKVEIEQKILSKTINWKPVIYVLLIIISTLLVFLSLKMWNKDGKVDEALPVVETAAANVDYAPAVEVVPNNPNQKNTIQPKTVNSNPAPAPSSNEFIPFLESEISLLLDDNKNLYDKFNIQNRILKFFKNNDVEVVIRYPNGSISTSKIGQYLRKLSISDDINGIEINNISSNINKVEQIEIEEKYKQ